MPKYALSGRVMLKTRKNIMSDEQLDHFFDDLFRNGPARDVFNALVGDVLICEPSEADSKDNHLGNFLRAFAAKAEAVRRRNAAQAA